MTDHSFDLDYLIIGAGPAGLQLGYYLERRDRRYLILEKAPAVASFFRRFPRTRGLISFNKRSSVYADPEINLRWDWNSLLTEAYDHRFADYSKAFYPDADEMVRYLEDFHEKYGLAVRCNSTVTRVERFGAGYRVRLADGEHITARAVVVATGNGKPHIPDIPGIEHAEGYETVDFDPDRYLGKRVLIIGKGNSGFEFADAILSSAALIHLASPSTIRMAWTTRHPGHVRAQYTSILDAYQLKTLHGALDCQLASITQDGDAYLAEVCYTHADGEVDVIAYDHVIRAAGFRFDDAMFADDIKPERVHDGRFPAMSPGWESLASPNLFFAGTLMQARDFRQASSAFIDGFRYNVRTLFHLMEARYFGEALPGGVLPAEVEPVAEYITDRICRTSSLWTQFGHLADVFTVDRDAGTVDYRHDLPIGRVTEEMAGHDEVYTVTLEWGQWDGDVFAIERHPKAETAYTNVFLHPIIRRYCRGEVVETHHVLEDLLGVYAARYATDTVRRRSGIDMETYHRINHAEPLRAWLDARLGAAPRTDAQTLCRPNTPGASAVERV